MEFKTHVQLVPIYEVPSNANVISSHTLYKIKIEEDNKLMLKARIASHGNEDSTKDVLKTDCCICIPIGIRIFTTIAALKTMEISERGRQDGISRNRKF